MLLKFAFRNVLRNKRRSFLTALAIFFAAMIVGLAQSFVNGMLDIYMQNYITYQTGHIRITTDEFIDRERFLPVDEIMVESDKIMANIQKLEGVADVKERLRFGILLGHQDTTVEALGVGLELKTSRFNLPEKLVAGELGESGIYIGQGLAKRLGVDLGDALLLATKTSEGGLNGIKLPIKGLVRLGITMFDKRMFFINLADAKKLLKIYAGTTELFVFADNRDITDSVAQRIKTGLPPGVTAQTFKEQLGGFYTYLETAKVIYLIIETLILFLASFVVINTMMMAIFERLHEIGTLKAIGMSDRELFLNFTLEGAIIGAAGGIPGALVGYLLTAVMSHTGINMQASLASLDMPIEYIIHPTLSIFALITAMLMSILIPALAAMIPARYAGKLQPAEALRK